MKCESYGKGTMGNAANCPLVPNISVVAATGVCAPVVICIVPKNESGRFGKSSLTNIAVWLLGCKVLVMDA